MQVEKITGKYYIYHLHKHKKTLNISHKKFLVSDWTRMMVTAPGLGLL